jgi:hypothetical protein
MRIWYGGCDVSDVFGQHHDFHTRVPGVTDVSIQMLNDRRKQHDLRRLILIGSLLALSVRQCAEGESHGACNHERAELAALWDHQLNITRPHLMQAEAGEKKR